MDQEFLDLLPESIVIEGSFAAKEVFINSKLLLLAPSLKVVNHSPEGFGWGYFGSGPAQMALAILMIYLPKSVACKNYQHFKFGFIGYLPRTDFIKTINLRQIMTELLQKTESF